MQLTVNKAARILGDLAVAPEAAGSARGQGSGGTINCTVTDATGAVIRSAKIEIVNSETGVLTTTETRINGEYYLPNTAFGEYNISTEADGLKRAEVTVVDSDWARAGFLAVG